MFGSTSRGKFLGDDFASRDGWLSTRATPIFSGKFYEIDEVSARRNRPSLEELKLRYAAEDIAYPDRSRTEWARSSIEVAGRVDH